MSPILEGYEYYVQCIWAGTYVQLVSLKVNRTNAAAVIQCQLILNEGYEDYEAVKPVVTSDNHTTTVTRIF